MIFHIGRSVVEGDSCWVESQNSESDGQVHLIASNHFTVNEEGLIAPVAVFPPDRHPPKRPAQACTSPPRGVAWWRRQPDGLDRAIVCLGT